MNLAAEFFSVTFGVFWKHFCMWVKFLLELLFAPIYTSVGKKIVCFERLEKSYICLKKCGSPCFSLMSACKWKNFLN